MSTTGDPTSPGATEQLRRVLGELLPGPATDAPTPAAESVVAGEPVAIVPNYRLAVFAKPSDPHVLAELLSHVLGERPLDALIHSRHTPGVLPYVMTRLQANELVTLLHGVGLQAAAVSEQQLPDLSNATVVHHARCRPEGFEIVDLYGAVAEVVPWSELAVIAAGLVPGETVHHFIDVTRPSLAMAAPHAPTMGHAETHGTDTFELWLFRHTPIRAYYIHHRQFNYEDLGDDEQESAAANFEVFAQRVVNHATTARRTPSTRAYLARDIRSKYAFASSIDLQQHALVQWVIGQCTNPS